MKKSPLFYFGLMLLTLFTFSCADDQPGEPLIVEKILGKEKDCTCLPVINEHAWKSSTVYTLGFQGPLCQWVYTFHDENGDKLLLEDSALEDSASFFEQSTFIQNIYSCQP